MEKQDLRILLLQESLSGKSTIQEKWRIYFVWKNIFLVGLDSVINLGIPQVSISKAHYLQSQHLQVMSETTCADLSGLLVTCTSHQPKYSGIIKQILRKSSRTLSKSYLEIQKRRCKFWHFHVSLSNSHSLPIDLILIQVLNYTLEGL